MTQSYKSNFHILLLLVTSIAITVMSAGCAITPDPRVAGMKVEAADFQQNNKELYKRVIKAYYNYERVMNSPKFEASSRLVEANSYFAEIGLDFPEFKKTDTHSWFKQYIQPVMKDLVNGSPYVSFSISHNMGEVKKAYDI